MSFTPPPAGTVRGPFESSPGNPQRYQACYRTIRGGWAYAFAGTPTEALRPPSTCG